MKAVTLDLIVNRIIQETDDVIRLELVKEDGSPLPIYQAGAHIELQLPSGKLRHYSLCRLAKSLRLRSCSKGSHAEGRLNCMVLR
ncbi:hypothetical protein MAQ5080_00034 [Marinomonas aquimarina]|uniref:Uncharacterized protein n=1 Tax=Marinomonas aquimarina TaxID=295068 RepID=A0A1A8T157_9GAMM|nr:hypothetical protein MAQ5080_00034 [Marinomonas aquimarina]